jgi:hypothetical protein
VIYLKWDSLKNQNLLRAVQKIRNSDKMDFESAYRAGRITERLAVEQERAHNKNLELIEKYGKKDENGKLIQVPGKGYGEFEFEVDKKVLYEKEMESIALTEFVIKANRISSGTLKDCGLTPAEIVALDDAGILEPIS